MAIYKQLAGCEHNVYRRFVYPPQYTGDHDRGKTFIPGQVIVLVCPYGCEPLDIRIGETGLSDKAPQTPRSLGGFPHISSNDDMAPFSTQGAHIDKRLFAQTMMGGER